MISDRLKYIYPLTLEGFPNNTWYGGLSHRFIRHDCAENQLADFVREVLDCCGKKYMPIYRMADGEFQFILDYSINKNTLSGFIKYTSKKVIKGYRTCWGEKYRIIEYKAGIKILRNALVKISREGKIALYFAVRGDRWGENYFGPVCEWFRRNDIDINENNYVPFYFVYALFGKAGNIGLFKNKNVLVATWLNRERKSKIYSELKRYGSKEVEFYAISKSKSLFDKLDRSKITTKPDIALVGGGIGSANIISQLSFVKGPVIDVGIIIECLINPKKATERPFLLGD